MSSPISSEQAPGNSFPALLGGICFLDALFVTGVAAAVLLVLWLPVFPTLDGSVHVYYAHVLGQILSHHGNLGNFYELRRLIGPYCIHYFFLIALEPLTGSNLAEKLFIVVILLNLAAGIRLLARELGPQPSLAALFALPLLFSWPMGMGFLNFCLATGTMLWGLAAWYAVQRRPNSSSALLFALSLVLLVLSHPIPLLALILVAGFDLFVVLLAKLFAARSLPPGFKWAAIGLGLACIAFLAPISIANKSQVGAETVSFGFKAEVFKDFLWGMKIGIDSDAIAMISKFPRDFFRLGALASVLLTLAPTATRRWRLAEQPARRLCLAALLILTSTFFMPDSVNGSFYVAQRLWWLISTLLFACLASIDLSPKLRVALGIAAGACVLAVFAINAFALRSEALAIARVDRADLPEGKAGVVLAPPQIPMQKSYIWSGVRTLLSHNDVLLNSPWMDITISPLKAQPASNLLYNWSPGNLSNADWQLAIGHPSVLFRKLRADKNLLAQTLAKSDFIYYVDPVGGAGKIQQDLDNLIPADANWHCQYRAVDAVCAPVAASTQK